MDRHTDRVGQTDGIAISNMRFALSAVTRKKWKKTSINIATIFKAKFVNKTFTVSVCAHLRTELRSKLFMQLNDNSQTNQDIFFVVSLKHKPAVIVTTRSVAWHGGKNVGLGWQTFTVARSTFSWWVTTYVGKPSTGCQPTRSTQPFILFESINE